MIHMSSSMHAICCREMMHSWIEDLFALASFFLSIISHSSKGIDPPNAKAGCRRAMKSCLALFLFIDCVFGYDWTSMHHQCCTNDVDLVNKGLLRAQ